MDRSGGLLTEYSFSVWMCQVDYWLNIYLVYRWVRRITDRIFIRCIEVSGGLLKIFIRCIEVSGGLLTEYSFGVWIGQADYRPNIHSVYGWVRRITDRIFIQCMDGPGGLPTKYSLGVWIDQADCRPNIYLVYWWVRRITDRIFIQCFDGSGKLPNKYICCGMNGSGSIFNICLTVRQSMGDISKCICIWQLHVSPHRNVSYPANIVNIRHKQLFDNYTKWQCI